MRWEQTTSLGPDSPLLFVELRLRDNARLRVFSSLPSETEAFQFRKTLPNEWIKDCQTIRSCPF